MGRIVYIYNAVVWTIIFGVYIYWWRTGVTLKWEYLFLPFFLLLLFLWRECFKE